MTLVKICGLSTPDTLRAALDAGADMIGLVHFEKSPRHVDLATGARLAGEARGRALVVALVVDPTDALLDALLPALRPDLLQLHGQESIERVAAIRARAKVPVMKAVGVASAADIARARTYIGVADRLLLDAKAAPGALPGGNGLSFDWRLVADLDPPFAFMLSGGLKPETVGRAIYLVHPDGVDVSSGVESAPGIKDPNRIAAFVKAARATQGNRP